jgi:hypothetical protein
VSVEATSNSKPRVSPSQPGVRLAARSSLDVLLGDAALERGIGRFVKPRAAGRTIAGLARHPRRTASDAGRFGIELARVATGRSDTRPSKGDRRFGERAWQDNGLLRRLMQSYLATCETVDRLISDAGLDWRTEAVEVLGTPIDLGEITLDSYAIAGLNDHIVPRENAYRSAQLLGGANASWSRPAATSRPW